MRIQSWLLSGLFVLGGCTGGVGGPIGFSGFSMTQFFTFDGQRTWHYVNEDISLDYFLVADLLQESEVMEDGFTRKYTIEFTKDCINTENGCVENEFVRSMQWSSNDSLGTFIHSYELAGGDPVVFDPPLQVTPPSMKREDSVSTETDGKTWTSTFVQLEECPVQWAVDWDECARIELDDGDGDLAVGSPVSGVIWVVTGYNVVAAEWPGEPGRWELLKHDYTP